MKVDYYNNKRFIPKKTIDYIEQSAKEYLPASDIDLVLREEFNDFWTNTLTEVERKHTMEVNGVESIGQRQSIPIELQPIPCYTIGVYFSSDCGCCGNYSGRCWVCTLSCYLHDLECWNCSKWHCGPSCVPGCPNF